jgi:uncharacterized protein (TIGR02147 family)
MAESRIKPDIFDYLNFREYLRDCLPYLRKQYPAFRFQTLVEKFGLKSRSHYIDIIKGRKLTDRFIKNYVEICGLSGKEAQYLEALVRYDQTKSASEKIGVSIRSWRFRKTLPRSNWNTKPTDTSPPGRYQ